MTVFLTIFIAKMFKNGSQTVLLLSGILINGFMSSILAFIKYFANPDTTLASITYWEMGSFQDASFNQVLILFLIVAICSLILLMFSWRINIISLGKDEAQTKGLNYNFYKYAIIIISTLLTAVSVCFCGKVSWIGLVIPHIVRLLVGRNTKRSIPLCITFGAIFMIICDIISRLFTDSEIPISAITGLFGTLIFVIVILLQRRKINEYRD